MNVREVPPLNLGLPTCYVMICDGLNMRQNGDMTCYVFFFFDKIAVSNKKNRIFVVEREKRNKL